jgi:hypothetical protein
LLLAVSAGIANGLGINTGHELGHKKTQLERNLAKIVLAVPAYGHFCIEHNRGHHRDVATPEDPASSRMGESIYKFARREIPGAFRRAWEVEDERLTRKGVSVWSWENEILQSYAITFAVQISLIAAFGWVMIPFPGDSQFPGLVAVDQRQLRGALRAAAAESRKTANTSAASPITPGTVITNTPTWCCFTWSGIPITMPTRPGATSPCVTSRMCRACRMAITACSRWPMCHRCGSR